MKGLTNSCEISASPSSTSTEEVLKIVAEDSEKKGDGRNETKVIITMSNNNPNKKESGSLVEKNDSTVVVLRPKSLVVGTNSTNAPLSTTRKIILPEPEEEEEDDEADSAVPGLSTQSGKIHCKIVNAFTKAFAKQNIHFEKAIQTLDALNDQIIAFIFSTESEPLHLTATAAAATKSQNGDSGTNNNNAKNNETTSSSKFQQEAVKTAIALMRRLLLDAQGKFRKMVEENKALGGRLDGDLQSAHVQMALLRAELTDTNKRLSLIGTTPPSTPSTPNHTNSILIDSITMSNNLPNNNSMMMMNGGLSTFSPASASAGAAHNNYDTKNHSPGGGGGSSGNGGGQLLLNGAYSSTGSNNNSNSSNHGSLRSSGSHHRHHHELDFEESTQQQQHFLDLDSLSPAELRKECERLFGFNQSLQVQLKEIRRNSRNGGGGGGCGGGNGDESRASSICSNSGGGFSTMTNNTAGDPSEQLQHAKEALSALKTDRKRLKAEKFELLNQMKQLYVTLEDKEKELRDFIRNYEQRMRESETSLQRLAVERDEAERERWSILRHARDEAERGLALATQLNLRESQVQQLQEELHEARRQLSQFGIYAEPDNRSNTNNSHYSLVSSLTATYATMSGDRGSSADSGVRLSSDRDSGGCGLQNTNTGNLSDSANEALSLDLCGEGSGDGDSMSVISTATLPQLFATPRDSPGPITFSSITRSLQEASALSKSAEQLLAAEAVDQARRKSGRRSGGGVDFSTSSRTSTGAKGAWGSISRVFARNKHRRAIDSSIYDGLKSGQRSSWSPQSSVPPSPLAEQESYGDKLRALEEAATLPMELWRAGMVQAWIEVSLGMPQYGSRCGDNVKSGKVLLELSDLELETELGITHPLHRKKLRLAIEEHRNPALVRFPGIIELSHVWVSSEWLPDIGLPQYVEHFAGCLVDARLLDHLSKKDLEKYLGVTRKFHLASIAHGVHLLRMMAYDRQALAERRRQCENDPLVWTNARFVQWARSIDLHEYSENLKGSGVHGAFAVLEPTFNGDTFASAMGIPPNKQIIRRHLTAELDALLNPARAKITQQYRVTKSRLSTLEKQRSDSLGRNATLGNSSGNNSGSNDSFRRSTVEESRRRTSLRSSLSRALGLKLKQDLAQQRRDQQDQQKASRPTDFSTFVGSNNSSGATGFNSPYLPSPSSSSQYSDKYYAGPDYGKGSQLLMNGGNNGSNSDSSTSPFHTTQATNHFASSSRPHSVTSMPMPSTSTSTMKDEDIFEKPDKILETEIVDDEVADDENKSNNPSLSNSVSVESIHKLHPKSVEIANSKLTEKTEILEILNESEPQPSVSNSTSKHNHAAVHTPV